MIEWLKNWTNSIIVAVIIAVIFELIIPNGNNKKYIKMVINLYVLFVILNPLISKFTSLNGIDINTKDYEKYFKGENVIETSASLNSEKLINSTAEKTLKDNIKSKLKEQGYNVISISIDIDNNSGEIKKLKLSIKKEEGKKDNSNCSTNNTTISINQVEEVNISNQDNSKKKESIRKSEIQNIKKIINEEYEITEENIEIN